MRTLKLVTLAAVGTMAAAAPASAAIKVKTIASGLDNPRHVAVGPHGAVYVAEAGTGGNPATSKSCFDTVEGPACTGDTGAITRIRNNHQHRVADRLASFAPASGESAIGPHGIYVKGRTVLFTNGGPTGPTRGTPPQVVLRDPTLVAEEPVSRLFGTLLKLRRSGGFRQIADIWANENANNPDGQVGNPLVDSNAVDVLADRGRYIVADAGGNTLLRVSQGGAINVLSIFPNVDTPGPSGTVPMNAVPTGVVKGPDGAYYMSQLTGFPFPVGGAHVFRVNRKTGNYTTYASGFTNAMDLAFGRNGTLYVLEIDHDSLLAPSREGAIWAVRRGGGTPKRIALPAGTLTEPGGIAVGRNGKLYVSNHAREAGEGQVLQISLKRR